MRTPRKQIKNCTDNSFFPQSQTNQMEDPPKPCFPTLVGLLIAFQRGSFLSFPSGCSGHPLFLSSCWLSAELSAHLNQQHLLGAPQTSTGGYIPTQLCSSSAETQVEPILGRKGLCQPKARGWDKPSASIPADSKKQLWMFLCDKLSLLPWGWLGSGGGCMCGSPQPPAPVPNERDFGQ